MGDIMGKMWCLFNYDLPINKIMKTFIFFFFCMEQFFCTGVYSLRKLKNLIMLEKQDFASI